jgi:hypothetical protein
MAHFARLNETNVVIRVHVVNNDVITVDGEEREQLGVEFLSNLHGGSRWKQTSYNTRGGIRYTPNSNEHDGGVALRKNYAAIGYTYDEDRDAFIPLKPYDSWLLDEPTCTWEAPVPQPKGNYTWNEQTQAWDLVEE